MSVGGGGGASSIEAADGGDPFSIDAAPDAVEIDDGPPPITWHCELCSVTITEHPDGRAQAQHLVGKTHLKKLRKAAVLAGEDPAAFGLKLAAKRDPHGRPMDEQGRVIPMNQDVLRDGQCDALDPRRFARRRPNPRVVGPTWRTPAHPSLVPSWSCPR